MKYRPADVLNLTTLDAAFNTFFVLPDVFGAPLVCANLACSEESMPLVKCPHCGKEVEFSGNEFRPFCSERCKLLDFGAWADEEYALPAETSTLSDEDVDKIEKALEETGRQ
jgi:endogenous inhibitor of DNA gyrase (YacG/DUF329 family)